MLHRSTINRGSEIVPKEQEIIIIISAHMVTMRRASIISSPSPPPFQPTNRFQTM
ncbi:hypothetical protein M406DRAFT_324486 [Cryphonectria parasitica EP155]|uniref:Uncharacterized protein n=1 Tax=Cryphonectria parasitica (strain ATCC 38755 / EP155) TaxID=660469 RepID=A0A9P4XTQ5_CRYP1|nr:uncharacterized protein M406DRAFT_324486 [Cryphonectria parasitica EP155]KAF3760768.1 hypothetical protein M406DRAFT_324486 [Cryphonectria parasitica EP155]